MNSIERVSLPENTFSLECSNVTVERCFFPRCAAVLVFPCEDVYSGAAFWSEECSCLPDAKEHYCEEHRTRYMCEACAPSE